MPEPLKNDETLDILCNDRIRLVQKKKGYRLSIDPLLLANFIKIKKHETLLDVGTGCGIIPIYMAKKGCPNKLAGIEIQDELYELSQKNKALNDCSNVHFIKGDVRTSVKEIGSFNVVVSNPPYVKDGAGRKSPGYSRLVARSESMLDLPSLMSAAASLLLTHGRLYLIYPAKRLSELFCAAKDRDLEPRRLRLVHSRAGEPAVLFLIECMKGGGVDMKVEPPLYIFSNDDYTEEIKTYYV
jgi:tRNA1Val (adenine37-N6)-methyltransferase